MKFTTRLHISTISGKRSSLPYGWIAKQISIYFGPQATPFQIETAVAGMTGFLPMVIEMREHRKTTLKAQEIKQLIQQLQTYVLGGLAAVKRLIDEETI